MHQQYSAPTIVHSFIPAGTALVDSPLGLGTSIRSPPHNDSVAYVRTGRCLIRPAAADSLSSQNPKIYAILKEMQNKILGGVLDSGTQRGTTGRKSEILKHTGTSLLMQPAVGPAKHMTGILMGAQIRVVRLTQKAFHDYLAFQHPSECQSCTLQGPRPVV